MNTKHVPSWLAVDVGNSRVKFGLFSMEHSTDQSVPRLPDCRNVITTELEEVLPWSELQSSVASDCFCFGVVAGSNQQGVDRVLTEWPAALPAPLVIRDSSSFPLEIEVDQPRRVGLDRLLNAIAANQLRSDSQPAIIVDCGTATTIDLVSSDGEFSGGAILPGFTLCAKALNHYTEVLPLISLDELYALPASQDSHPALGKNTLAAIMSGVFWGQIGAVKEVISRLSAASADRAAESDKIDLLLTGGGARLLAPYLPGAVHCPWLPLQGLVLAASEMQSS